MRSSLYALRVLLVASIFALDLHAMAHVTNSNNGFVKGMIMATFAPLPGGATEDLAYYLRDDSGAVFRLQFCSSISAKDFEINIPIIIEYSHILDGVIYSCQPPRQEPSRRKLFGTTISGPTRPNFLVYIVTMCGYNQPAAVTPKVIADLFTGASSETKILNLADYYNTCSYGQVQIQPSQVRVMKPVEIPCSGKVTLPFMFASSNTFTSDSCENENLFKWQYYLDSVAMKEGIVPGDYHHKIIVLPKGFSISAKGCNGFAGLANPTRFYLPSTSNTWGTTFTWMTGDVAALGLDVWFHELGHNLGLQHGDTAVSCRPSRSCDPLCAMGFAGPTRCFNAPHNWQLGWAQPFRQMTETDIAYGKTQAVTVPPQMSKKESFVMITLSGMPSNQKIFVSARTNVYPWDRPYNSAFDDMGFIAIHTYDGVGGDILSAYKVTILLDDIAEGQTFVDSGTGLVVRFDKWDSTQGATVIFCRRRSSTEKACGDGLDDDCDFLPDYQDPDCMGSLPGANTTTPSYQRSPPTPKPPPFPRATSPQLARPRSPPPPSPRPRPPQPSSSWPRPSRPPSPPPRSPSRLPPPLNVQSSPVPPPAQRSPVVPPKRSPPRPRSPPKSPSPAARPHRSSLLQSPPSPLLRQPPPL